jgi:hypothetical protein
MLSQAASFPAPFSKDEKGEKDKMKTNKEDSIQINPRTGYQLRNKEVYCSDCGRNFGDIYTLQKHRIKGIFGAVACVDPQAVNMTAYVNFSEAIVWGYSKW